MSDSVYSFRAGPTYRAASRQELFDSAMEQPLSLTSTFFDQAKGGMLESYGLGTAVRDFAIPDGAATPETTVRSALRLTNPLTAAYESTRLAVQAFREDSPTLDETKYKASPYYRENIPWDAGMTEARAKALAEWNDAKQVRQYYAQKRPITAFLGNLTGQAFDPINYIPVGGPLVKAAAAARAGRVGGAVITGAVDAATNTALAGFATRETRGRFGDDVSFQAMVSEIATAALIGAAFGGIAGAIDARTAARTLTEAQRSLATLKTTQEARIALNEAIDAVVRGEDVRLSPNATEAAARAGQDIQRISSPPIVAEPARLPEAPPSQAGFSFGARKEGTLEFFHGSPKQELTELAPSTRGPLGPGVYLSSFTNVAQRYAQQAGDNGRVYSVFVPSERIFHGDGVSNRSSDVNPYQVWRDQSARVVAAAENADKDAIAKILEDAGSDGGYQAFGRIAQHFRSQEKAQELFKRAGYDALSGYVDGPELVVFGKVSLQNEALSAQAAASDTSPARPETTPEGRPQAEARIAKPDDYKALTEQYRVDPETGDFPELADIDNLRAEGRLTADDIAELDAASATVDDAKAYGEALRSVVACLV